MKKRQTFVPFLALALALCLSGGPSLVAHANSAQTYWYGRDVYGAIVTDERCPIEVERETLTLRAPTFPSLAFDGSEGPEEDAGSVTAEYLFRNPAAYDVSMTLVFPFGMAPDYLETPFDDAARYAVSADGKEIPRAVRHTYASYHFDADVDLLRLSDGKRSAGFLAENTPVAIYHYRVETEAQDAMLFYAANFSGLGDPARTRVMLSDCSASGTGEFIGNWADRGVYERGFSMYVFGDALSALPEWDLYETAERKQRAEGSVLPDPSLFVETTFGDLLAARAAEGEIGETDRFNAALDFVAAQGERLTLPIDESDLFSPPLMRWFEYELSVPAGKRVVNAVTAPLYPDIDGNYLPPVYRYTYLLSPASRWASFGSLDIRIETPFFVTQSSVPFEKTEGGYTCSLAELPEGELTFSLSEDETPKRDTNYLKKSFLFYFTYFGWILIPVLLIAGTVTVIVIVRKKRRRKQ